MNIKNIEKIENVLCECFDELSGKSCMSVDEEKLLERIDQCLNIISLEKNEK
jgi:hypothetical protein